MVQITDSELPLWREQQPSHKKTSIGSIAIGVSGVINLIGAVKVPDVARLLDIPAPNLAGVAVGLLGAYTLINARKVNS